MIARLVPCLLSLGVVVAFLLGSATTERLEEDPELAAEAALPTLSLKTERRRPDPVKGQCPATSDVVVEHGPVPPGAEVVAELGLAAKDGVSSGKIPALDVYERVLAEWAAEHCCVGVSVLSAEIIDGTRAVTAVSAAAWTEGGAAGEPIPSGTPAELDEKAELEAEERFWD